MFRPNFSEVDNIKVFEYRKSQPDGIFFTMDRAVNEEFEQALAKKAGTTPDNHTGYLVTNKNGGRLFVYCTDDLIWLASNYVLTR